jgi:hypothetical protein
MKIKGRLILAAALASFHLGNAADVWSGDQLGGRLTTSSASQFKMRQ